VNPIRVRGKKTNKVFVCLGRRNGFAFSLDDLKSNIQVSVNVVNPIRVRGAKKQTRFSFVSG
jgi:hypothetical protein